jgi:hypothetical protein
MHPNTTPILAHLSERERRSLEARFMAKVKIDPISGCHNWTGAIAGGGYGQFGVGRGSKVCRAHRVAYELAHGPIPPGQIVRHECNNRRCVNPEHLTIGTHQDNMDDMTEALRGRAKLTNRDVTTVVGLLILGKTPNDIAPDFAASVATVKSIQRGERRPQAIDRELDRDLARAQLETLPNWADW